MNTKLLYVIVSSPADVYLEQACVSMYSAKMYEPSIRIEVLTDNHTINTFSEAREKMVSLADEIVSVVFPDDIDAKTRSRLLKTSARQHITGDYLFIDTDTIVTGSLREIDDVDCDIAAVKDMNGSIPFATKDHIERRVGKVFDSRFDVSDFYFNSGVMYVKDSEVAHEFYRSWNRNYKLCVKKGIFVDQLSLVYTNHIFEGIIRPLGSAWNTMLKVCSLNQIQQAKIIHYFNDGSDLSKLNKKVTFADIKDSGVLNEEIEQMIKDPSKLFVDDPLVIEAAYKEFLQSSFVRITYRLYEKKRLLFVERAIERLYELYNTIRVARNR